MFESLKHWFSSLEADSKLFDDADDEVLHGALASLLYHFIALDDRHSGREKHEFDRLMKTEFDLDQAQIDHLYQAAKSATGDPHEDLHTINAHLRDNPSVRMRFMQKLLQLINLHGTRSAELDLFYETLHEVFPDVRTAGSEDEL
jgi:uncharacterized tellurite resistance protein B-like protein